MKKINNSLKKLDNKGFTLVELIIVIAIIAVLAAVLAPQYIKYVEKSKVSADKDTAAAIEKAINVVYADGTVSGAGTFTWSTKDGGLTSSIDNAADAVTAITGAPKKAQSKVAQEVTAGVKWTVTVATDGTPSIAPAPDYTTWGTTAAATTAVSQQP